MPRYPARPLEERLAWMRERQRAKEEEARRKEAGPTVRQALANGALPPAKAAPRNAPPEIPPERKMLRIETVAEMLAVSTMTVRRWFANRAIIVHPGPRRSTMLISQKALDDWFAEHAPPNSR